MNKKENFEYSLYDLFDYLIKYKYILLGSFFIPFFLSLAYYLYQPKTFEYHVNLVTNNKLNYKSEEALSLQNININYQILRSLNISRDLLVRMTENINPVAIISKHNYLMTLEDIITNENDVVLDKYKELKILKVVDKSDDFITLQYEFSEINNPYEEIKKINFFINNMAITKVKTAFEQVNQQFRKLTEIGNLGTIDENRTNELLFYEIEKVFEKYKIFNTEEFFFIDEKKTTITLLTKIFFKIGFVIIIPLFTIIFVTIFLFLKSSFKSYNLYKSGK